MDRTWEQFVSVCQGALGELVEGRPEPFKALWSHADDVVIMGAFGGHERGWEQVRARLDWAAKGIAATDRCAENIVTTVGEDLAFTVDLEHMTRHLGDRRQPRTLRCTQAYRERTASGRSYSVTPTNFPSPTSTKVDTPIRSPAHSPDNGDAWSQPSWTRCGPDANGRPVTRRETYGSGWDAP